MRGAAGAVLVLAASMLTGCVSTHTCVSWVHFESAQEMYDEAVLVVEGVVGEEAGTIDVVSGPAVLHEVEVRAVHKGELDERVIRAASPRDYCVEDPPQPEDPLREGDEVLLFLRPAAADDGSWETLTSMQGVLPADGALPFEPDDDG